MPCRVVFGNFIFGLIEALRSSPLLNSKISHAIVSHLMPLEITGGILARGLMNYWDKIIFDLWLKSTKKTWVLECNPLEFLLKQLGYLLAFVFYE